MSLGPLQVLIVNFDETNFSGEIEAELARLEEAGTLRVLDVLVVAKSEPARSRCSLARSTIGAGAARRRRTDDDRELEDADEWAVADAIEPGGAAAIAVLEHRGRSRCARRSRARAATTSSTEWVDEGGSRRWASRSRLDPADPRSSRRRWS